MGLVTGPGEAVIEPAAVMGGGIHGLAAGSISCMSGTGPGGSGRGPGDSGPFKEMDYVKRKLVETLERKGSVTPEDMERILQDARQKSQTGWDFFDEEIRGNAHYWKSADNTRVIGVENGRPFTGSSTSFDRSGTQFMTWIE
jgi:hypothetical protein